MRVSYALVSRVGVGDNCGVALVLDRSDPAGAARIIGALADWRRYEPARAALMKLQLERLAAVSGISRELRDGATAGLC